LARKIAALSPGRPYWDPLVNWLAKKVTRDQAVDQISARYREFVTIFETHQQAVTA
jgi:myo-inositol catabolism protein IolC